MSLQNKNRLIAFLTLVIIVLVIIIALPFLGTMTPPMAVSAVAPKGSSESVTSMDMMQTGMASMQQKTFALDSYDSTTTVPTVDFTITSDSQATPNGYDIHVITTNFTFTPQNINTDSVANAGHAHLYIDGNLIVLLGDWYHINSLSAGKHIIEVTLNANDHSLFTFAGKGIEMTRTITTGL